jgi:hypothetical protein
MNGWMDGWMDGCDLIGRKREKCRTTGMLVLDLYYDVTEEEIVVGLRW